jgi:hypothetical protein
MTIEPSICAIVELDDKYIVVPEEAVAPADPSKIRRKIRITEERVTHYVSPEPPGEYIERPHFTITAPVLYETLVQQIDVEHRDILDLLDLRGQLAATFPEYSFGPVKNY